MPILFAATMFVSAMLLFMVQPMIAKLITPMLGGSPAVWNTCSVFFQTLLLIGYLYAHNLATRVEVRTQVRIHLSIVGLALAYLIGSAILSESHSPIGIYKSLAPQGAAYPIFGVLLLLAAAVGLPFLVLSTSAPLLQRWFAYTGHASAKDPYFLYAASNTGSLLSLLGYPFVIEPRTLPIDQAWIWTAGYGLLLVMVYFCGRAAANPIRPIEIRGKQTTAKPTTSQEDAGPDPEKPTTLTRLRWLGYAFVPSSLMLGVTTHMTTDIASVPLLWVIPLSLYLLTFIIAYASQPTWLRPLLANLSPVLSLLLVFVLISNVMVNRTFYGLLIHLVVYFFTALLMHVELAKARPKVAYLTEYFVWISVGGMLGGMFNALIAPILFPLDYEYPIAITIGCLLIPVISTLETKPDEPAKAKSESAKGFALLLDFVIPIGMVALVGALTVLPEKSIWFAQSMQWIAENSTSAVQSSGLKWGIDVSTVYKFAIYAVPCMICFFFIDRPIRFGLCVGAVLGVCLFREARVRSVEELHRSYFGIMKIERYEEDYKPSPILMTLPDAPLDDEGNPKLFVTYHSQPFYKLLHGTTLHGVQSANRGLHTKYDQLPVLMHTHPWNVLAYIGMQQSWDSRQEPLTYYHRTGPVGAMVQRMRQIDPLGHIGMVGLGTGSVACYALPGQKLTFYEIDRTVVDIVNEGKYFTYVNDARKRGAEIEIILGDARLRLEENQDRYALLLIDAFSSDSIPVHLLTKEAMLLYKDHLLENGILALHISNRYIDLEPVVARLAQETGFVCRVFNDENDDFSGKTRSSWVILAQNESTLGETVIMKEGDTRFGAVAGGIGWLIFDNSAFGWYKHPWRVMKVPAKIDLWTDGYADVTRVMRLPEIQTIRRFFRLPVLDEDDE